MRLILLGVIVSAMLAGPATAQQKSAVRPGFAFPTDHPARILVFRPDVKVGAQSAGGTVSPNADWTLSARKYIGDALTATPPGGAQSIVFMPEPQGEAAEALLSDYRALFGVVADTVLHHRLFKGDRLPTKKTGFEYSVGPQVSRLAPGAGGDFALFIFSNDAYGSAGRKLLQITAMMAGVGVTSGQHTGYAGLIDLKTGDLVWMNANATMGGNVRTPEGATKRVGELLSGIPASARQ